MFLVAAFCVAAALAVTACPHDDRGRVASPSSAGFPIAESSGAESAGARQEIVGGRSGVADAREAPAGPASPAARNRVLARGIVLTAEGAPAGAGVGVELRHAGRLAPVVATTTTTEGGKFEVTVPFEAIAVAEDRGATVLMAADARSHEQSLPVLCLARDLGPELWLELRLGSTTELRLALRTAGGAPVANGLLVVANVPRVGARRWQQGERARRPRLVRTDERGEATLFVRGAAVRVWGAMSDGAFGPSRSVSLDGARRAPVKELIVEAPERWTDVRLRVVDEDGSAVPGAIVRTLYEESPGLTTAPRERQRGLGVAPDADGAADGEIVFRTRTSAMPLLLGIASRDHQAVSVLVGRRVVDTVHATVRLRRKPRLDIGVVTPSGAEAPTALNRALRVDVRASPGSDFATRAAAIRRVSLAGAAGPHDPGESSVLPALMAEIACDRERVRAVDAGSGIAARAFLPHPGGYLIRAALPGIAPLQQSVDVSDGPSAGEARLRLPLGRMLALLERTGSGARERGPGADSVRAEVVAWFGEPDLPEHRAPPRRAFSLPDDGGSIVVWAPIEERTLVVALRHGAGGDVERVSLPFEQGAAVEFDRPRIPDVPDLPEVAIETVSAASSARVPYVTLRIRQVECSDARLAGVPVPSTVRSGVDGVARVRLPPGRYAVRPDPARYGNAPVTVDVGDATPRSRLIIRLQGPGQKPPRRR